MKYLLFVFFLNPIYFIGQSNLINNLNPNVFGSAQYTLRSPASYDSSVSHMNDGSGSLMFPSKKSTFLSNKITSKRFYLTQGSEYLLRFYIKMEGPVHGQNLLVKITSNYSGSFKEMQFNVSEIGEWEEVIMPYYAEYPDDHYFQIFSYKYLISTDGKYVRDTTNLAECPTVHFDDFSLIETIDGEIISNEPRTPKPAFNSSYVKIDTLGNFSVKENGDWKHIFPRLAYRSHYFTLEKDAQYYSEYGFNGIVNANTLSGIQTAISKGCKYNSIQINNWKSNTENNIINVINALNDGSIPISSLIMYTYDNEAEHLTQYITEKKPVSDWLDSNVLDPITGKRSIPVFELCGVHKYIGRTDRNGDNNLMDVTGCYVTWSGEATGQRFNPINTIELMDKCDGLSAHSNIMEVQSYFHETFIPSVFKGIMQGAKGLEFWRGGTTHNGSKKDFRQNVWADGIKGINGAFARIDSMLEDIIVQPIGTTWKATITSQLKDDKGRPTVAIGTRSNLSENRHFIIMSNFADTTQNVTVLLTDFNDKAIQDYFTKKELSKINSNGEFTITIEKNNNGYLILEIGDTTTTKVNEQSFIHNEFRLFQNYPNPFNPSTVIKYSLPESLRQSNVKLMVYDILGREVVTLVNKLQAPGNYKITWNATEKNSGIYFYKIQTEKFSNTKKMLLLR